MKRRASAVLFVVTCLAATLTAQLPAVSWTCPMHPEVLEDRKGGCNICGMDLEPVRLVTVYTCPVHAVIQQPKAGSCRICARSLVSMTAELTFTCADNRDINQIEAGTCADGAPMLPRYAPRAHGDHNPKHGGLFFMAPDSWHHIEGTYPSTGRFRLYVYDDYSKPLDVAAARKLSGRIVTKEVFDPKTGTTRELAASPLVLARSGAYFEGRIESLPLPAKMTVKMTFKANEREGRFDFAFDAYSKDLPAPAALVTRAVSTTAPTVDQPDALLDELRARQAEVTALVKSANYAAIYLPALQAKDTALEIQARSAGAGTASSDAIEVSVKQIVLAAYQLDNFGDMGDGQKVQEAFVAFSTAVSTLDSLIAGTRR